MQLEYEERDEFERSDEGDNLRREKRLAKE
jgi:hypothetical protein